MIVMFLMILEITFIYTLTVCGVIALLTAWEWIIFQLKEEVRIVESQENDD